MSVVIVGGGIIGLSTAYYLTLLDPSRATDHKIHIIDNASDLFLSASGYAGGFLARDWFSPSVASLGDLSFRLHKELADSNDGARKWGYAPNTAYSLAVDQRGVGGGKKRIRNENWAQDGTSRAGVATSVDDRGKEQMPAGPGAHRDEVLNDDGTPAWITKQEGGSLETIDDEGGCAQVEPKQLCQWLLEQVEERGVKVHRNCVAIAVCKDQYGKVEGVKVKKDMEIYAKHAANIIITAGAWTPKAFKQIFHDSALQIPIGPLAGYSVVVRSPRYSKPIVNTSAHHQTAGVNGTCHSVFCAPSAAWSFAPEAISRIPADGKPEIYVAGLNAPSLPLPDTVDHVKELFDKEKAEELRSATILLTGLSKESDELLVDDLELVREGLCFRPVSASGKPVITRIPDSELGHDLEMPQDGGVYVAAGHGPWGISLSLGTGLSIAEMVLRKKTSADISGLGLN